MQATGVGDNRRLMDTRNSRGIVSALLASWIRIGYLMEGSGSPELSLDKKQQEVNKKLYSKLAKDRDNARWYSVYGGVPSDRSSGSIRAAC
ncbi:hypothetical protein EVAR_61001_1 [Eumeta japonica]|uniref:Uncharacterized protein n=1 Tax=Eumeta variegata TaxID=151549 RepID=A0A4C1Z986_EUMVA|nr:hypothetical protein EVAR_61001_1 [Eumeta japonica]